VSNELCPDHDATHCGIIVRLEERVALLEEALERLSFLEDSVSFLGGELADGRSPGASVANLGSSASRQ